MYIKEDLSVNNTRHVSPKKSSGASLTTPIQSERDKEELLPLHREAGQTGGGGWSWGHQSTSIIQLNTRKKPKHIRLHFLSLTFVDFFCQGFEWFCLDKRLVHLHKHTLVFFFSLIYIYNPLWFTFTVCATTSHRRGVGSWWTGWRKEALIRLSSWTSLASWDVDRHQVKGEKGPAPEKKAAGRQEIESIST